MRQYRELLAARGKEIKCHLALISELNSAAIARHGVGKLTRVETEHVEILKSGFLVHLYNVVEAVMDQILLEVVRSTKEYPPAGWSDALRTEWIRAKAGVERDWNSDKRLSRTKSILDKTINGTVGEEFRIAFERNWSNDEIEKVSRRLDCELKIIPDIRKQACCIPFENDLAPMKYVRHKRNRLSHGNETFGLGAKELSPHDLNRLRIPIMRYMSRVTSSYDDFLDSKAFLREGFAA